jgi:hypothetical protein
VFNRLDNEIVDDAASEEPYTGVVSKTRVAFFRKHELGDREVLSRHQIRHFRDPQASRLGRDRGQ